MSKQHNQPRIAATSVPKAQAREQGRFSINLKLALILGLVSFFVYANTLTNGFVLDDHIVIKDNYIVLSGVKGIP